LLVPSILGTRIEVKVVRCLVRVVWGFDGIDYVGFVGFVGVVWFDDVGCL
jgi:hypothetical protein